MDWVYNVSIFGIQKVPLAEFGGKVNTAKTKLYITILDKAESK